MSLRLGVVYALDAERRKTWGCMNRPLNRAVGVKPAVCPEPRRVAVYDAKFFRGSMVLAALDRLRSF